MINIHKENSESFINRLKAVETHLQQPRLKLMVDILLSLSLVYTAIALTDIIGLEL